MIACGQAEDIPNAEEGEDTDTEEEAPPAIAPGDVTVPIAGATLAISPDGLLAAASDIAGDHIVLVDIDQRITLGSVALVEGDQPGRLLVDDDGIAYVALRQAGDVAMIDLMGGVVLQRTAVCPSPRGLTFDTGSAEILLVCASGELVTLNAITLEVVDSVFVEHDLRDIVVDGDDLLVSTFKRGELLTVTADGAVIDRRVAQTFGNVLLENPTEDDVEFTPGGAWRTVAHPSGGALMIHQRANGSEIDTREPSPYSGISNSTGCSGLVHTSITWFPPDGGSAVSSGIIASAFLPVDGAVLPDGRYAVVAAGASDKADDEVAVDIVIVDDTSFDVQAINCSTGVTVHIPDDSQVTAVAYNPEGTRVSVGRSPFRVYVEDSEVALGLPVDPDPEQTAFVDDGFNLFHKDANAGMTCASCHLEGMDDGRTWFFSELGPRRTQSMAGGLSATAPFHWGGEFEHFNMLMDEVLVKRMGHAPISPEDVAALAFWMESLRPTPVTPEGTPEEVAQGEVLFTSQAVGCGTCHAGDLLTSNVNANVGTGGGFQVPSLRGIGLPIPVPARRVRQNATRPLCDVWWR